MKSLIAGIVGLGLCAAIPFQAEAQAWRTCVPGSMGPGGCESMGPGGGRSMGLGGGESMGPRGGRSMGPGGGGSMGPGGGLSMDPSGGQYIGRDQSHGFSAGQLRRMNGF